ncbi:MAG: hypothetical protein IKN04_10725 [Clostridia bacterium]|nr:hypothetical protein [Clostridia bacterium]
MEQVPVPASFIQPAFILLDGRVIPLNFPYLSILMQGRPQHEMDEFAFRHPRMDQGKRAKIFAPFDALDGYGESVSSKNIVYTDPITLDEGEQEELNRRLNILHNLTYNSRMAKANRVTVTVKYYVPCTDEHSFSCGIRGQYLTETGVVWKVDTEVGQTITVGRKRISFRDIVSIAAEDARLFDLDQEDRFSPCL